VQQHDGGWIGIIIDVERGTAGLDGTSYFTKSPDASAWDVSIIPVVPKLSATHDKIYKTGFGRPAAELT
jgi:hypothetical protein